MHSLWKLVCAPFAGRIVNLKPAKSQAETFFPHSHSWSPSLIPQPEFLCGRGKFSTYLCGHFAKITLIRFFFFFRNAAIFFSCILLEIDKPQIFAFHNWLVKLVHNKIGKLCDFRVKNILYN